MCPRTPGPDPSAPRNAHVRFPKPERTSSAHLSPCFCSCVGLRLGAARSAEKLRPRGPTWWVPLHVHLHEGGPVGRENPWETLWPLVLWYACGSLEKKHTSSSRTGRQGQHPSVFPWDRPTGSGGLDQMDQMPFYRFVEKLTGLSAQQTPVGHSLQVSLNVFDQGAFFTGNLSR